MILDAYAVVAFLRDEPAAAYVEPLLTAGSVSLTAVGLAEVLDRMARLGGRDADETALDLVQLGLFDALPTDAAIGSAAGRLRAQYYRRIRCAVSMADCIAAETARAVRAPVATANPALLSVCHRERIDIVPLPGSDGTMWSPDGAGQPLSDGEK